MNKNRKNEVNTISMSSKKAGGNNEKKKDTMVITRKMTLGEAVARYPKTAQVMMSYGLHCIGCHVAAWESIEDGARGHGLSEQEIDEMITEMNKAIKK
ncbi:MAG: DUF1858 domain-containing protein [Candidatus Woesearchaeota archaeon]